MRAGESVAGAASRCPPSADGDFTASSKQAHFLTAVASDHLRSSSYGASANLARSRHSGATAERRPYLPAELLCDMEMQKVRQSHLPMPLGGQPHLERLTPPSAVLFYFKNQGATQPRGCWLRAKLSCQSTINRDFTFNLRRPCCMCLRLRMPGRITLAMSSR
jgi:hypothetical protein